MEKKGFQEQVLEKSEDKKYGGLIIPRFFLKPEQNPFQAFRYQKRTSTIRNPDGSVVFELNDIEVPEKWSQVATDILAQKYFRKKGVPQYDEENNPILDENGNHIIG